VVQGSVCGSVVQCYCSVDVYIYVHSHTHTQGSLTLCIITHACFEERTRAGMLRCVFAGGTEQHAEGVCV
jgi:hypothetical protein